MCGSSGGFPQHDCSHVTRHNLCDPLIALGGVLVEFGFEVVNSLGDPNHAVLVRHAGSLWLPVCAPPP